MAVQGDGPEGQPGEGVATMTDLVALMDDGEESVADALDESEEGEEVSDEAEGEESEQSEDEDDQEQQEEPTVTLKHDGKEVTLKQSEVVELAQKGFDYTHKTMQVAEERKAVETARAEGDQYRKQYEQARDQGLGQLKALEKFLEQSVGNPPPLEWAQQDAAYYIAQKEQYEARKGQLADARQAIAQLEDDKARTRQAWIADKIAQTETALKSTLPGWNEETMDELVSYAGKHGIDDKSFDAAPLEKGFWEMVDKAKRYDALLDKKAQMKPVSQLPKVAQPRAQNQPTQLARRQDAVKRYNSAPSIQTLADLL